MPYVSVLCIEMDIVFQFIEVLCLVLAVAVGQCVCTLCTERRKATTQNAGACHRKLLEFECVDEVASFEVEDRPQFCDDATIEIEEGVAISAATLIEHYGLFGADLSPWNPADREDQPTLGGEATSEMVEEGVAISAATLIEQYGLFGTDMSAWTPADRNDRPKLGGEATIEIEEGFAISAATLIEHYGLFGVDAIACPSGREDPQRVLRQARRGSAPDASISGSLFEQYGLFGAELGAWNADRKGSEARFSGLH